VTLKEELDDIIDSDGPAPCILEQTRIPDWMLNKTLGCNEQELKG